MSEYMVHPSLARLTSWLHLSMHVLDGHAAVAHVCRGRPVAHLTSPGYTKASVQRAEAEGCIQLRTETLESVFRSHVLWYPQIRVWCVPVHSCCHWPGPLPPPPPRLHVCPHPSLIVNRKLPITKAGRAATHPPAATYDGGHERLLSWTGQHFLQEHAFGYD